MGGLDAGPDSIKEIQEELSKCKTVVWNGPMGVFEMDAFAKGTFAVAETLSTLDGITIIGGGDSVAAVEEARAWSCSRARSCPVWLLSTRRRMHSRAFLFA